MCFNSLKTKQYLKKKDTEEYILRQNIKNRKI